MQVSQDIRAMLPVELELLLAELGQPKYRAKQLFKWLQAGVHSYDEMTDLPKSLRTVLSDVYPIYGAEAARRLASRLDETRKYLFRLHDGQCVESVLMKYNHGYSICVSTQVGCRMGCVFCATGRSGYSRNLTPSEILAQITEAQRIESVRISNVVLMGMGEPLDNMDNVLRFHREGKMIAAICAAPSIFAELGLLKGIRATCNPGFEHVLIDHGADLVRENAVTTGNVITSRGMGTAIPFALAIVEHYLGRETAEALGKKILYYQ
ncbi:MAG: radical SAM protein [Ruminococcaceae bacterium]|nr:radical SAM protein [Oscillospiraceae bacterium]